MMNVILLLYLMHSMVLPVRALDIQAPAVPNSGADLMPQDTSSFPDALEQLLYDVINLIDPNISEALKTGCSVFTTTILISVYYRCSGKNGFFADIIGTAAISALLLRKTDSLIQLAVTVLRELNSYGKLLFPVMSTALAAQGGISASAGLYTGTMALDSILSSLISALLIPGIYSYLAVSIAGAAFGEAFLKNFGSIIKNTISWMLKLLLSIFTTYMSITGIISGTTDAAALKATKFTISSFVPVVGGILSDASEAVLVSAGLMKTTAGVYGILAFLAIFLAPFLRIGCHYLILRITAGICSTLGTDKPAALVDHFATAMGLLLAMTGSVCLLLLISTICFMKGLS